MIRVGMSTSSVFPLSTEHAFRLAGLAGFDGIEVMVTEDPVTRDADALLELSRRFQLPILSVHAPVLALTQFIWGLDPLQKLERTAELALAVGAKTVVVHPPYRWQARFAQRFHAALDDLAARFPLEFAVENMFPLVVGPITFQAFAPVAAPKAMTLDFSHAALAGRDSLELAMAAGKRLRHVHLCDGRGSMADGNVDEHLVPGLGTQPVAEVLQYLGHRRWKGSIVAEVATRGAHDDAGRLAMLTETVRFARQHIGVRRASRQKRTSTN